MRGDDLETVKFHSHVMKQLRLGWEDDVSKWIKVPWEMRLVIRLIRIIGNKSRKFRINQGS